MGACRSARQRELARLRHHLGARRHRPHRASGRDAGRDHREARAAARHADGPDRRAPGDAAPRPPVRARRDDRGSARRAPRRRGARAIAIPSTCSARARARRRRGALFRILCDARSKRSARAPRARSPAGPGISVKLSALHPRYVARQRARVHDRACAAADRACRAAKAHDLNLTVDAEEADRLELSLEVFARLLREPSLAGWDGLGLAVQAYRKRAPAVIDWLAEASAASGRRLMVRLVKGAYWDTEIKRAQERGLADFPVFTRKPATDLCYLACAERLLAARPRLYPQFATHNALTVAAIIEMARRRATGPSSSSACTAWAKCCTPKCTRAKATTAASTRRSAATGTCSPIWCGGCWRTARTRPSSTPSTNAVPIESVLVPTGARALPARSPRHPGIALPETLRRAQESRGRRVRQPRGAGGAGRGRRRGAAVRRRSPDASGRRCERGGRKAAVAASRVGGDAGRRARGDPRDAPPTGSKRARPADRASRARGRQDAPRRHRRGARGGRLLPLLRRRGAAAIRPTRSFPARPARRTATGCRGAACSSASARGTFRSRSSSARSPPRSPRATRSLAKPAEQTPKIAREAVALLHAAGVPEDALLLVPGDGRIGAALVADPRIAGVAFTGSTEVGQIINRALAAKDGPIVPLIAETGGINAMIADSTALPEQVADDVVTSAFRSAGQRCSACRILFVQEDVADTMLEMIAGAAAELRLGDPADPATDVGPVIDREAKEALEAHLATMRREQTILFAGERAEGGQLRRAAYRRAEERRGADQGGLRPDPACRALAGGTARRRARLDRPHRLRADLRHPHPRRRARRAHGAGAPRRQRLRQPQHDRRDRRLAAVRRHGAFRHRAEGRRARITLRASRMSRSSPPTRRRRAAMPASSRWKTALIRARADEPAAKARPAAPRSSGRSRSSSSLYFLVAYVALPRLWTHYEHEPGLEGRPMVTVTADGIPGDPLNVGLVGSKEEAIRALAAAGWYPADRGDAEDQHRDRRKRALRPAVSRCAREPALLRGQGAGLRLREAGRQQRRQAQPCALFRDARGVAGRAARLARLGDVRPWRRRQPLYRRDHAPHRAGHRRGARSPDRRPRGGAHADEIYEVTGVGRRSSAGTAAAIPTTPTAS